MLCYNCMREKGAAAVCPHCGAQEKAVQEPHHIRPGTVIGNRYTLGNVIGEGGFGITYIALENTLGITVAIKEYYPFGYCNRNTTASNSVSVVSADKQQIFEKGRSRFLNEAKTLAKFQVDPGVVNVIDFLQENNTAYIVMEYLDGITLREYLKQNGNLTPEQAVTMLLPAMRALVKIHNDGIIHRDISPDNIMMLRDGSLKLMDFGAARDYDGDNRSMSIMLKQGYAPAEQYRRNGKQGPWTDVYGMCATIYRCITGVAPVDSIDRIYQDTLRRPSDYGIAISPSVENTIMFGLAVHKEDRCQDMETLINLFEKAFNGGSVPPPKNSFRDNQTTIDPNQTVAADMNRTRFSQERQQAPQGYPNPPQGYHPPVQQYQQPPQQQQKRSYMPLIAGLLVFIAVLSVVIAVIALSTSQPEPSPSSSSEIEKETEEPLKMPDLTGMTKEEAISTLSDMNLKVDTFTETESDDQDSGKVFDQVPKKDAELTDDSKITLYIAKAPETDAPSSSKASSKASSKKAESKSDEDEPADDSPGGYTLYCTARSYVVVHSSASTGSGSLGKVWIGESVTCLSSSSGWYYIDDGSVKGYVSSEYFSTNSSMVPQYTDPLYVDSDVDFLSLRSSASETATELAKIPPGTKLSFSGTSVDHGYVRSDGYHVRWAKVLYNGEFGYVYDLYVHD